MDHCIESLRYAKINISDNCPTHDSSTEISLVEVSSVEFGHKEVSPTQVSSAEVCSAEVNLVKSCLREISPFQVRPAKVGSIQINPVEISSTEMWHYLWMLFSPLRDSRIMN